MHGLGLNGRARRGDAPSLSPQPGKGGILAAQPTGGTDGDSDVAVPIDARFTAAEQSQRTMAKLAPWKGSEAKPLGFRLT
jgi:hypothetical protein